MNEQIWLPHDRHATDAPRKTSVGVFLPVSTIFPECVPSLAELKQQLKKLSRTDALFWCARLNLVISNATEKRVPIKQRFGVQRFFTTHQIERIAEFYGSRNNPEATFVFFRHQILDLIQWIAASCHDFENDGTTFESECVREAFAKSLLIAGDLWGERVYSGKLDPNIENIDELRTKSLGATRTGTEAASTGSDPILAIGRGRAMFTEHMIHFRPSFTSEFQHHTGLDIDTFYAVLSVIALGCLLRAPGEGAPQTAHRGIFHQSDFAQLSIELGIAFDQFAKRYCQSPDELTAAVQDSIAESRVPGCSAALKAIRQRPILRTNDGRCIVLDPVYFSELAAVGPLFAILSSDSANKCFEDFGHTFERYACSILRSMYPAPPPPLIDRLCIGVQGTSTSGQRVQLADAALIDADTVLLFEIKASWLPDKAAESSDPYDYVSLFRDKYAKQAGLSQPKGAGQIARTIAKLASGEWGAEQVGLSPSLHVYPVLVCYDEMLESGTHPWFLAEEFRVLLAPDELSSGGVMHKGRFRVSGLTVLTIDILEYLEASVENFGLANLLRDYSMACPDRVENLRTYMSRSRNKDMLFANRTLAKHAATAFKTVRTLSSVDSRQDL